jgi:ABC-type nickel/cobalt efflux system permease component RcnA
LIECGLVVLQTILQKKSKLKAHFPQAEPRVFETLDVNEDKVVDHDEWHKFEEAHGAKHKHG